LALLARVAHYSQDIAELAGVGIRPPGLRPNKAGLQAPTNTVNLGEAASTEKAGREVLEQPAKNELVWFGVIVPRWLSIQPAVRAPETPVIDFEKLPPPPK
jgi:hypothetical protein